MHLNAFKIELYEEHLEEAAFLYETRVAWLDDDEVSWLDIEDLDQRAEAHLDALVVGEAIALSVLLQASLEADANELHVIVRLLARQNLYDRFTTLLKQLDASDLGVVKSVAHALELDAPQEWMPALLQFFSKNKFDYFPLILPVLVRNKAVNDQVLDRAVIDSPIKTVTQMLSGQYILGCSQLILALKNKLSSVKSAVYLSQIVRSLVLQGDKNILLSCEDKITFMPMCFALVGAQKHSQLLLSKLKEKPMVEKDALLAIGLFGYIDGVQVLLSYLSDKKHAQTAAQALHILSGAPLFEDVHEPEEVDKDELFDFELDAYAKGEKPKNIDGDGYGVEAKRLTLDSQIWFSWFKENRNKFASGVRYRFGRQLSAQTLLNNLSHPLTPNFLRKTSYQELVIHFGLDSHFNEHDLIYNQKIQINKIYHALSA